MPSEDAFLGAVSDSREGDPWTVKLTLQGKSVTLYIDSGAEVTVITEQACMEESRSTSAGILRQDTVWPRLSRHTYDWEVGWYLHAGGPNSRY